MQFIQRNIQIIEKMVIFIHFLQFTEITLLSTIVNKKLFIPPKEAFYFHPDTIFKDLFKLISFFSIIRNYISYLIITLAKNG